MAEIQDFFIKENTIEHIPEEAYNSINHIIDDIDAYSRTTYKSVYIIDYFKQNFLYVSDNPLLLCGMTADEVKELGYSFYINQVTPEDLNLLLEVNVAGFMFLANVDKKDLCNYTISYDFHIVNKVSGKKWLINHQITPLRLTEEKDKVWLALCAASISSRNESGNIFMSKNKSNKLWQYNRNTRKWKEIARPELKEIEMDVLKLSAMGYTMQEIAEEVNRSFDTVKVYRKSLFEKLGVENIVEAINLAKNQRII